MSLAPDLFAPRYDDLVQIARSRLPGIAPDWTDYNAHDPGITLVELLAWTAEAQLYGLSRMRRDERAAYARLMGIASRGTEPARGMIWPDPDDHDGPEQTIHSPQVIEADAAIMIAGTDGPQFVPTHPLLWVPARIAALESRSGTCAWVDHLSANRRGSMFRPLGDGDGRNAVLRIKLAATGPAPLFAAGLAPLVAPGRADKALLAIGVRAVPSLTEGPNDGGGGSPLAVRLTTDEGAFPLPIVEDGTRGMLRTGVLLLDVTDVPGAPSVATIEIRAPRGLDRAPRILRIAPNVIPVVQRVAKEEHHDADGLPDQAFDLETRGLSFAPGTAPVAIEVLQAESRENWTLSDRLADCGPGDRVFAFDPVAARVTFGNGLNGAIPPAEAVIVARYAVCDGRKGNIAANRKWTVRGFSGVYGTNADGLAGGADAPDIVAQRGAARAALREAHALVSAADFEAAARALPGLDVARARTIPPRAGDLANGTMRMVVLQARADGREPKTGPETARWLAAVRRALAPRMLLGMRLDVVAPRYVGFAIRARVESEPRTDPVQVRQAIADMLTRRLALTSDRPGVPVRDFGQPLTSRDLSAWIQSLPAVRRVAELAILPEVGGTTGVLAVGRDGLPRIDIDASDIRIMPAGGGGSA